MLVFLTVFLTCVCFTSCIWPYGHQTGLVRGSKQLVVTDDPLGSDGNWNYTPIWGCSAPLCSSSRVLQLSGSFSSRYLDLRLDHACASACSRGAWVCHQVRRKGSQGWKGSTSTQLSVENFSILMHLVI